jgi:transcriptional regulator with XRE-family HTH domain
MTENPYSDRIRTMRTARAWSQEQLAQIAGISPRTVQRAESVAASFDSLKAIASAFNIDVGALMAPPSSQGSEPTPGNPVSFLLRIQTGTDLFKIVGASNAFLFDQDELSSPKEAELVASFLQDIHDYIAIWSGIEPGDRVRIAHEYTPRILELEASGLCVFAMQQERPLSASDPFKIQVAVVCVTRPTNPAIVHLDQSVDALPTIIRSS